MSVRRRASSVSDVDGMELELEADNVIEPTTTNNEPSPDHSKQLTKRQRKTEQKLALDPTPKKSFAPINMSKTQGDTLFSKIDDLKAEMKNVVRISPTLT